MKPLCLCTVVFLLVFFGCAHLPPREQYPYCLNDEDCNEGEICVRQCCQEELSGDDRGGEPTQPDGAGGGRQI